MVFENWMIDKYFSFFVENCVIMEFLIEKIKYGCIVESEEKLKLDN